MKYRYRHGITEHREHPQHRAYVERTTIVVRILETVASSVPLDKQRASYILLGARWLAREVILAVSFLKTRLLFSSFLNRDNA
jgi:hypothetical protein